MAIEHINRKGDRYHLQAMPAKDGKLRYSFARKLKGQPVDAVPDGHEVYEKPDDGQVFLRRKLVSAILPLEKEMVRSGIKRLAKVLDFIVDVEKDALVVYICELDEDEIEENLRHLAGHATSRLRQVARALACRRPYAKMMRFGLQDATTRMFDVQRWCFSGSIDNWIFVDGSRPLADLVEEYAVHLGRESFFESM